MRKNITMTFSPDGESKIETKGFAGKSCLSATTFLEEALGIKGETTLMGDYYQTEVKNSQQVDQI
jgi:hypothetical protein